MSLFTFAALIVTLAAPARAANTAYGFSPTAVEGSARAVGTGGSILASPKDYSAVFVNPAGLGGLAGDGVDFGSDSNNIDNFIVDVSNPKARALNDPLKFSFYGFRYVTTDGWGFGFAAQTPYQLDDVFAGTTKVGKGSTAKSGKDHTEIKATTTIYTVAAAKTYLDKRLSVGLAANYIQVAESYDFQPGVAGASPEAHLRATNDALSADVGLLASPWKWLQAAAVFKMGWRVPFDPSRNADALGSNSTPVQAFRDGKTPDKLSVGLRWSPSRYFGLMAQSNVAFAMKDTAVVGSGLFPGVAGSLSVGQTTTVDGHWGFEIVPVDEPDLTMKFWAGGYLENTGLQGGYTRYHRTAGASFQPWFLGLSMAIDDAELYNNFTVGLGVDMLEVAQRVSKKYGWKLPL
jgi:hypothetical protein